MRKRQMSGNNLKIFGSGEVVQLMESTLIPLISAKSTGKGQDQ